MSIRSLRTSWWPSSLLRKLRKAPFSSNSVMMKTGSSAGSVQTPRRRTIRRWCNLCITFASSMKSARSVVARRFFTATSKVLFHRARYTMPKLPLPSSQMNSRLRRFASMSRNCTGGVYFRGHGWVRRQHNPSLVATSKPVTVTKKYTLRKKTYTSLFTLHLHNHTDKSTRLERYG